MVELLDGVDVPVKKTRRRGNKIEVDGILREVVALSEGEVAEWFHMRMPLYYELLHELVTSKGTPVSVRVKLLELIVKLTGQVVEKHEVAVINPSEIGRRGIEAVKELGEFRAGLEVVDGSRLG